MNTIAAVDASGKTAGVCILQDGTVLYEETLCGGLVHSRTLLPLVQKAFRACSLSPSQVSLYAVTAGPGSFTGLRIGIALVKGFALPHSTPVAPVSTLASIAAVTKFDGIVVPALDARRSEVYWAAFDNANGGARLVPDSAGPAADIPNRLDLSAAPIVFVGDGAEICYNVFNYGQDIPHEPAAAPLPIARGAANIALRMQQSGQVLPAGQVHPFYLRLSQAERERRAGKG